jgi:hypothetical protein
MAHELEIGILAGGVSLVVAMAGAYVAVWSVNRQRTVALIVAALEHMTGGSQERGAGLAALAALRGTRSRDIGFGRRRWLDHQAAIGQHLYRQLIYVMNYGSNRGQAHEIENIRVMLDLLLSEDHLIEVCDRGQVERLQDSLNRFAGTAQTKPGGNEAGAIAAHAALSAVRSSLDRWNATLEMDRGAYPRGRLPESREAPRPRAI